MEEKEPDYLYEIMQILALVHGELVMIREAVYDRGQKDVQKTLKKD